MRAAVLVAALVPLISTALCGPPPEVPPQNEPPVARVVWPQLIAVTEPVAFDATASDDPEGAIESFRMTFGDGTEQVESASGAFEHLYGDPGSYDFVLRVRDEGGLLAEVTGNVVVVTRTDDPICSCELPCLDDASCTTAGCFLASASDADAGVPEPPGDAIPCD